MVYVMNGLFFKEFSLVNGLFLYVLHVTESASK